VREKSGRWLICRPPTRSAGNGAFELFEEGWGRNGVAGTSSLFEIPDLERSGFAVAGAISWGVNKTAELKLKTKGKDEMNARRSPSPPRGGEGEEPGKQISKN